MQRAHAEGIPMANESTRSHLPLRGGGAKRKEGTAALRQQRDWQGKKEGVRNGATVLGIQ